MKQRFFFAVTVAFAALFVSALATFIAGWPLLLWYFGVASLESAAAITVGWMASQIVAATFYVAWNVATDEDPGEYDDTDH